MIIRIISFYPNTEPNYEMVILCQNVRTLHNRTLFQLSQTDSKSQIKHHYYFMALSENKSQL